MVSCLATYCIVLYCTVQLSQGPASSQLIQTLLICELLWSTALQCNVMYCTVQVSQGPASSQLIQTLLSFQLLWLATLQCNILYCTIEVSQGATSSQLVQTLLICELLWSAALQCNILYKCHKVLLQANWYNHCLIVSYCDQLPCNIIYCTVQVSQGAIASQLVQTLLTCELLWSAALQFNILYNCHNVLPQFNWYKHSFFVSYCDQLPCSLLYCTNVTRCCCKPTDTLSSPN